MTNYEPPKRIIRNRSNWIPQYETNFGGSQTLPDQTMPIRTLLERYARGIPVHTKEPIYEGEENDLPDISRLDYAERQEYALQFAKEYSDIQTAIQENEALKTSKNGLKIDSPITEPKTEQNGTENQTD